MGGLDPRWGPQTQNITIERAHYERILAREKELLDENRRLRALLDEFERRTLRAA